MSSDPRATMVLNNTEDVEEIQKVIAEVQGMESTSVDFILSKFREIPAIKNELEFMKTLFFSHLQVIIDLIEWMLMPKFVIEKQKITSKVTGIPYQCKEFMKDSWCFYEQLYIYARNQKLPFSIWFNFLQPEHYDAETVNTALGYFTEVLIPFAKYQFSGSFDLTHSLDLYQQGSSSESYGIMKIISKNLFSHILQFCHFEAIYNFVTTAILVSIEDPIDQQVSRNAMIELLQYSQKKNISLKFPPLTKQEEIQLVNASDLLENISKTFKQTIQNIQPERTLPHRIEYLIQIILKSKIISYAVEEISRSRFCVECSQKLQIPQGNLLGSGDLSSINTIPIPVLENEAISRNMLSSSQTIRPFCKKGTTTPYVLIQIPQIEEEDMIEILVKILTSSVEIFIKMPQWAPATESLQVLTVGLEPNETDSRGKSTEEVQVSEYHQLLEEYQRQIQSILDGLYIINRIVYPCSAEIIKTLPSSSGQNIKPESFIKYSYLLLLYNCLLVTRTNLPLDPESAKEEKKEKNTISITLPSFSLDVSKLKIVQIIQKYLSQNRWNNIVHHLIQKICHFLIMNSYDYLRTNIEKDRNKKLTDSFLAYLIENFTQRDYIFLNTFKFTSQGNLHSLYNIAKDLAYTLNSTNQLAILINEFEPWKKFLMTDLKKYEEKTYPKATVPDKYEENEMQASSEGLGVKVDEADSIGKLIKNISVAKKWPSRKKQQSSNSKSDMHRKSVDAKDSRQSQYMSLSHGPNFLQKLKQNRGTLDDMVKKETIQGDDKEEPHQQFLQVQQFKPERSSGREKSKMFKSDIQVRKTNEFEEETQSQKNIPSLHETPPDIP